MEKPDEHGQIQVSQHQAQIDSMKKIASEFISKIPGISSWEKELALIQ